MFASAEFLLDDLIEIEEADEVDDGHTGNDREPVCVGIEENLS